MIRKMVHLIWVIFIVAACTASGRTGPKIRVENAWANPALPTGAAAPPDSSEDASTMKDMPDMTEMSVSAVYMLITNTGDEADLLTGVSSTIANQAELHQTQIIGDIAQMTPITDLEIPAHDQIEFEPGGYHVMLEGLHQDLQEGDLFQLNLLFKKSGAITVDVTVQKLQ